MKTLKSLALLFVSLFLVTSCEGPKGEPGRDGNANVISETVVTTAADWKWDAKDLNWYLDLDWDAIDHDMVDYGALLVYMENPGDSYAWHQLPLTLYPNDKYSTTLEAVYYDYALSLFWTNSDLQRHDNPCDFYKTDLTFKVVLIDAVSLSKHPNVDYSDYESVAKTFNVEVKENLFRKFNEDAF